MERHKPGSMAVIPLVAALLGLALLIVAAVLFINSRGFGYDFVAYDAAARRIAEGAPLYLVGHGGAISPGAV